MVYSYMISYDYKYCNKIKFIQSLYYLIDIIKIKVNENIFLRKIMLNDIYIILRN